MHITTTHHSGFLPAPIRMTWNDPECPIQLKVRFTDGTLDLYMLWLSELAMRDCMNVSLNCQRQKWGQWTVISEHTRFVRIFAWVYCRGATNRSWAAKLGYYSHYASSSLRCWDVWPFGMCTTLLSNDTKTDDLESIIMFESFIGHVCRAVC